MMMSKPTTTRCFSELTLRLAAAACLLLPVATSATAAQEPPSPERQVANAYGFEAWPRVQRLDFTFHVQLPGRDEPIARQWSWLPREQAAILQLAAHPVPETN